MQGKFLRWLYAGQRPNRIARIMNRFWAAVGSLGLAPNLAVTLEVKGRQSGRLISIPLVMTTVGGQRFLVSMLGERASWVSNVRAADGKAVLRHGRGEEVQLEEVPVAERATIIKAYLKRAPGARPHIPVDKNAPVSEFEKVAGAIPVFRVFAL